jgi:hypothetical protein
MFCTVVSIIRRLTVNPLQWYPKCSKYWSTPAGICTQITLHSLWPTQTRSRSYVRVMVVGVMCGITSSALTWLAWEGSIRWVSDHGEHYVMIHQPVSSMTVGTWSNSHWCSYTVRNQTKLPPSSGWMLNCGVSKCHKWASGICIVI